MRKHCTMAELLAVRDGEGTAWARTHVGDCPYCQNELDLLYRRVSELRALPAHRPPRDRWTVVREQAQRERRRRTVQRTGWSALALAAAVALLIGVRSVAFQDHGPVTSPELEQLIAQSRNLEATLRTYDPEGRVLNGRAAGIVADLEDRIALVDAGINQVTTRGGAREDLIGLWRDRVDLMDALVNAHVTRATYVGF
ncbi:MAG: hypothetical protein OEY20_10170 [Gemmatimonadota bacterium]|nr:hypothetical protein [Gemmatimonadota bacterium]MDH4350533.1 hypothetical protein [Gemmatimonadota bacterium]MDH5197606.1 hypothetical protein [Gemmatimonadota bacterium]